MTFPNAAVLRKMRFRNPGARAQKFLLSLVRGKPEGRLRSVSPSPLSALQERCSLSTLPTSLSAQKVCWRFAEKPTREAVSMTPSAGRNRRSKVDQERLDGCEITARVSSGGGGIPLIESSAEGSSQISERWCARLQRLSLQ